MEKHTSRHQTCHSICHQLVSSGDNAIWFGCKRVREYIKSQSSKHSYTTLCVTTTLPKQAKYKHVSKSLKQHLFANLHSPEHVQVHSKASARTNCIYLASKRRETPPKQENSARVHTAEITLWKPKLPSRHRALVCMSARTKSFEKTNASGEDALHRF